MMNENETKAILVRSDVQPLKHYNEYREFLRYDFCYSCAYCSMTEIESTAIGFEIDHYYPQKTHPKLKNDYKNLMWSCSICNRYKSDYDPDHAAISKGYIILRPDEHNPATHLVLIKYRLKATTTTGEFNLQRLELNREQLRRIRQIREKFSESSDYVAHGVQRLMSMRLDEFRPEKRALILDIKSKVRERNQQLDNTLEALFREFARSHLIDPDPEKKKRQKKRKEYLKGLKAVLPNE